MNIVLDTAAWLLVNYIQLEFLPRPISGGWGQDICKYIKIMVTNDLKNNTIIKINNNC